MNMTGMILTGKTRGELCAACSQTLRLAGLRVRAIHPEVTRHNVPVLHFYRREGFKDHDRHLATKRV